MYLGLQLGHLVGQIHNPFFIKCLACAYGPIVLREAGVMFSSFVKMKVPS